MLYQLVSQQMKKSGHPVIRATHFLAVERGASLSPHRPTLAMDKIYNMLKW